jgi:ABC-type nitrate/sulfonate/bicarbonate transport system substrate-binding protein
LLILKVKKFTDLINRFLNIFFNRAIEEAGLDIADFEFVSMDPMAASQALQTNSPNVQSYLRLEPVQDVFT